MDKKKQIDKGKVWLFLPLLVIPFLALGFYALGGGSGRAGDHRLTKVGINTELPEATFSRDTLTGKAEYYAQAEKKAARSDSSTVQMMAEKFGFSGVHQGSIRTGNTQVAEIDSKLAAIHREISRPEEVQVRSSVGRKGGDVGIRSEVDRLEMLMRSMQENKGEDAEMTQLNQLMQGILDIQHPERLSQRQAMDHSFYPDSQFKALSAYIDGNQKVVDGAAVRLKLKDTAKVSGLVLPKGQTLFGVCRLANQRLLLDIKHVRLGSSIVPVDLTVFGLDGMVGIAAPEAVLTGALNSGTDNAVRGIGMGGFDSLMGMQVATAGIDAARQLVSKRVRKVKVKLKAGTVVLLRDNKLKR